MANAGQAPLHRPLQLLLQCLSLGVALEPTASANWLHCNVTTINKVPDAARSELGWNHGAPEGPQSSRVEDGEVFWRTPPPQTQRGKREKCQSSAVCPCPHSLELSAQSDTISQNTCVGGVWVRAAFNYHVKLIYHVVKQTSTVTPMSI